MLIWIYFTVLLLWSFASLLLRLLKLCSFVILWLFVCCFCWLFCSVLFAGLFPAVLNLATNALITTNATCGEKGREMYCKLVEHVPGQPARNPQCRICDQRSRVLHRKSAVFSFISFKYTLLFLKDECWLSDLPWESLCLSIRLWNENFYVQSLFNIFISGIDNSI